MKEISIFKVLVPMILLILILIGVLLYNILKTPEEATIQQIKEPSSIKDRRDALKDAFK